MATNAQVLARVRDMLDEQTAAQWTDLQLRRWLNDGVADLARSTRFYEQSTDVTVLTGTAIATLPSDVMEIQHVYWISTTDSTRTKPLIAQHFESMDAVWGQWQNDRTGEPYTFAPRGLAPNLKVHLYPIPSEDGTLRVFYVGLPTAINEGGSDDSNTCAVPDGWVDILVHYIEYRSLRKDRDPRWQEALAIYNEQRDTLAEHDSLAVAREIVMDPWAGAVPRFIADPDYPY